VSEGHNPQLEKAVALALDAPAKQPAAQPQRPGYPNYHK
jgi:tricorn protease